MRLSIVTAVVAATLGTVISSPAHAQVATPSGMRGGSLQAQAAGVTAISLDEALRQAQAHSPQLVQARGQSRVANAQYKASLASFLPSVYVGQGTSHNQGQVYVQGVLLNSLGGWSSNQYYSASMTVFNGGQRILDYQAAKASLDAADQSQIIQHYAIDLNVKQQYFAVLANREAVDAAERSLEEAQQQMAVTNARLAGGAVSRADSLTSAVAVGQARVNLVTVQGQLATANAALTRLIGSEQEVTAMPEDTASIPSITLDTTALIALALNGPSVQAAQHQVAANRSNWWASLAAYLPSLSMGYSGGSGWQNDHFVLGGGTKNNNTALSFSLGWGLFDGLQRESRVVQADVARDNALATYRDARLGARASITQWLAQFRTAETRIALQATAIRSGEESVAAKDAQYRAGAVSLVDVLQAQSTLATARLGLIQARLDARTAKAQIEAVIGKEIE
ncbi:MAG TPA: TolC family protein [Gemmatimonadaceae bacterium]|jgi:outer membrane protein TolC|nr:TolC family protein [Gemmatimonadaceae bacterium]